MTNVSTHFLRLSVATAMLTSPAFFGSASASTIAEALTGGNAYGDFRLRYETVKQDNGARDADALTVRSRLGYQISDLGPFSALIEFESNQAVAGIDDYKDTLGANPEYSVIADPETTELDQGYLAYKNGGFGGKLGRQVITFDNHRFVGHVGWRQDRQTFDGLTLAYQPAAGLALNYAYIDERKRIFGDDKDIDSADHLFNGAYKTSLGTITAYAYLLEQDNQASNGLDTYGVRFNGTGKAGDYKLMYSAEYASQESTTGALNYDTDYLALEGGVVVSGVTLKLGYELLGSDQGNFAFSTPLATLHKFNGWSDQFLTTPAQGLADIYLMLGGKLSNDLLGGGKWAVIYHDFSADESTAHIDDLGSEVDLSYGVGFAKHYSAGIKYAAYSAGDTAAGKVDTDKVWLWLGASF